MGIIGAGIGGLSAGLMLQSIGCRVTIYEQSSGLRSEGYGIQISANGIRALTEFGLLGAINSVGSLPEAIDYLSGLTGKPITSIPLGANAERRFGAGFYHFYRGGLTSLLANQARFLGVKMVYGHRVKDMRQCKNAVHVKVKSDAKQFDLLIGADGLNSQVRKFFFSVGKPKYLKQVAYRFLVPSKKIPDYFSEKRTRIFVGPGKHVVSYPLKMANHVNFVFCANSNPTFPEDLNQHCEKIELLERFSNFPLLATPISAASSIKKWGLYEHRMAGSFHNGRILLLGDACHPMLPYLAQGATQAIEDAMQLSKNLRTNVGKININRVLTDYSRTRFKRVEQIRRASKTNASLFHLKNPVLILLFWCFLKFAGKISPNFLLGRFSWIYAKGPAKLR